MESVNDTQVDVSSEDIMRKYDRESNVRIWDGLPKIIVKYVMAVFSLYCIWSTLFSTSDLIIRLTSFLGLIVVMGYLTYPASKKHVRVNFIPWYDLILMVAGAGSFFYYCFNYKKLVTVITSASALGGHENAWFFILIAIVAILCLAELCRRCVGVPILLKRIVKIPLYNVLWYIWCNGNSCSGMFEIYSCIYYIRCFFRAYRNF